MRPAPLLAGLLIAGPALAGSVTVRNGTGETVREVRMGPAGGTVGENRMRSQLPPGAAATIGYSTGCRADLRLVFGDGRAEDHKDLDACAGVTITAGQEGVAGPSQRAPVASGRAIIPATATQVAPPPPVPPWNGRSITRRFGGME